MTVRGSSDGVVRAAGAAGWPVVPEQPDGGWALLPPAAVDSVDVEPMPAAGLVAEAGSVDVEPVAQASVAPTEGDDLVALLVALNRTGEPVYFDARPDSVGASSAA